ncbi:MAG TPA: HDOD domain-containing protein [Ilumatobacter sp.]|nr:HDOD domain-containing protein [Ilumatobacter sp.]
MTSIFIARQPILDIQRRTFGYELLHRDAPRHTGGLPAMGANRDDATRAVIERAFLHWGMERLLGDRFGFINANPEHIHDGLHRALPPESIIFELHDHIGLPPHLIEAVAQARADGYHFGIDNVADVGELVRSSVLPFVSMVKVDIDRATPDGAEQIVQFVRAVQPGVYLIAERVARHDQFELAADLGFDLFQGYFFAQPQLLERTARPANAAAAIALLAEIQRDDSSIERIEALVGSDPSLAYRVLAVVNSSAFGLDRQVESLRHAIVLLGLHQVRNLATLLTLSKSGATNEELITLGATRARLASMLIADRSLRSSAFTVGLLSVTDALYGTPIDTLLDELPLAQPVRDALVHGSGELGAVLGVVKACERADIDTVMAFDPDRLREINSAYADAAMWADSMRRQMDREFARSGAPAAGRGRLPRRRRRTVN